MSQTPILHTLSVALGVSDTAPDAELLRRFTETGDRTAFELVVRRHAELVWCVCRAALPHDPHAAEDAFQAAFLVLARKAASIRDGSAAGWLFRVARNAAGRARTRSARHNVCVLPDTLASTTASVEEEAARREVAPIVAEEVDRLGATLREPVVLCFFEGHTHAEAANRLGWPIGTVASRLARAKDVLRDRLTRRGVAIPAAGLAAAFAPGLGPAAPLVRAALAVATGPADQAPPTVLSLTHGALSAMRFTHIKLVAAVVAAAVGLTAALAAVPRAGTGASDTAPGSPALVALRRGPVPKAPTAKELEAKELKALKGEWRVVELEPFGKKSGVAGVAVLATARATISDNDVCFSMKGEKQNSKVNFKLALGLAESPHRFDLTVQGEGPDTGKVVHGIYERTGDTLRCCVEDPPDPKGRPTELKAGEKQHFFIMERIKDEKEELKALAGEWKSTFVWANGQEHTGKETEFTMVIERTGVRFKSGDIAITWAIRLAPSAVPPTIDLSRKKDNEAEDKQPGIYFRQGDKLTVCYAGTEDMNDTRPTALTPTGNVFIVFERAPKK